MPKSIRSCQKRAVAVLAIFLAGCATTQPPTLLPTPVSCIKAIPAKPAIHSDAELKAMPDGDLTLGLFVDRSLLLDYTAQLQSLLTACQ